ncbi:MAG TPA: pyrroloquinoline quinone-dependent dehydrogenase [Vicinamibacterales bacterium]|nr:pyrroloquinoline quinone-dependent dehydrogenase [Vicinamibacterales bacterium]
MTLRTHLLPIVVLSALVMAPAQRAAERIDRSNVAKLAVAWTYDTRDSVERLQPGTKQPAFEATPVYADGRLYLSTPQGTVAALDASTGAEIWRIDLQIRKDANYSDFANRGVTLSGDRIFAGTVDARLVCLERRDGSRCAAFGRNGQIDLTEGLRRRPSYAGEYGVTSPPAVYRDLVIVGSSVADNSRAAMSSGEVRAFDAKSGALRWTFHPLPAGAAAGGANTWSRLIVDEPNGLVFLPTGSASPDYFGGLRAGGDGYANSIVALRAATGEVAWHFQTVHHDLWDYDVASPPLLYPAKSGPAVAVGSKTGHLFLFDRLTGKPLFGVDERKVAASDVTGEQASPTQPFPTQPPSLVPQQVTDTDLWGATPEELAACRATFASLRSEGVFTPPSVRGSIAVPGNIGGLHWGGAAWDPVHRLIVAPVNRLPAIVRLIPAAQFDAERRAHPERETTEQAGTPYAMSRQFFLSPSGRPCVAPPWGELVAVNADTGAIAWRTTLGDLRGAAKLTLPESPGSPNLGGPLPTDTGLVFIAATIDPSFRAFDTRDGKEVWKAALPTSARATPMIFTGVDGRQMIVIAAGGHDTPFSRPDTKVIAFALQ